MLAKGTVFTDFYYTFSNREFCMWDILRAVDFKHAARSLYRKVPSSERFKRVRLYVAGPSDSVDYDGPVSGLRKYF